MSPTLSSHPPTLKSKTKPRSANDQKKKWRFGVRRWIPLFCLALILLTGLGIRLAFAPNPGAGFDMTVNQGWMHSAVQSGIGGAYVRQLDGVMLPNHGPVEIILYAAAGHLYRLLISPEYKTLQPAHIIFTKAPAMLADLLLCVVLYLLFRKTQRASVGLFAALVYALHPAIWFDSTLWGQTDGVYTFFVFAAFVALMYQRPTLATTLFLLGVLHKAPAFIFIPLYLLAFPWKLKSIIRSGIAALVVGGAVLLPFILGGSWHNMSTFAFFSFFGNSRLSWNAYNFWWALFGNKSWDISSNQHFLLGGSYALWGCVMTGALYALAVLYARPWRSSHPSYNWERFFIAAAVVAAAPFVFGAEMHERYMFPFVAFGMIAAFTAPEGALLYSSMSLLFFLNLTFVQQLNHDWNAFFGRFTALPVAIGTSQAILLLVYIIWMFRISGIHPLPSGNASTKQWPMQKKHSGLKAISLIKHMGLSRA